MIHGGKKQMKKSLAIFLALALVIPCFGMMFVSAVDSVMFGEKSNEIVSGDKTAVEETIAIDGDLSDTGWKQASRFTRGVWQNTNYITDGMEASYAVRTDADNIYVAVKVNQAVQMYQTLEEMGKYDITGSTTFRVWMQGDGMESRIFYDIMWNGESFDTYRVKEATDELTVAANTDGDSIGLEFSVAKTSLLVTDSFGMMVTVANPFYGPADAQGYNAYHMTPNADAADGALPGGWSGSNVMYATYACADTVLGAYVKAVEWSDEEVIKSEVTNVALGKGWTGNIEESNANYQGNLTDGIIGTPSLKYDGSDPWFGWDSRLLTETNGVATAIIDLGEVYENITGVGSHVWLTNASGIMAPTKIVYSASLDGENYEAVGEISSFAESGVAWETVDFDKYLSARYIKFEFTCVGTFTFVSELAVNVSKTAPLHNVGYAHAAAVSLVAGGEQTVAEITKRGHGEEKDMNYAYLVVVDRNDKVVATYTGLAVSKADVICPAGGYIISYNCNLTGECDVVKEIDVGATVTLHGVSKADMAFARTQDGILALENAYFTWDNSTSVISANKTIEVSHVNAYPWESFYNLVVYGEGKNCLDVSNVKEYSAGGLNWHAIKVENVDGVYTVTAIEAAGVEKTMTAPADGFILYCAQNALAKPGFDVAQTVKVGDILLVSNFDWKTQVGLETPLGTLTFGQAGEENSAPAADVDGDGELTAADQTALLQYLVGLTELPETVSEEDVDLDGNGAVDIYDTVLLLQYAAGTICEFPAE